MRFKFCVAFCLLSLQLFGQKSYPCRPAVVGRAVSRIARSLDPETIKSVVNIPLDSALKEHGFFYGSYYKTIRKKRNRAIDYVFQYYRKHDARYFWVEDGYRVLLELAYYDLLKKPYCFSQAADKYVNREVEKQEKEKQNCTADSIGRFYIPSDILNSFEVLDAMLHDSTKLRFKTGKNEGIGYEHLGPGVWIRNNWGLWGCSRLSVYFNGLGIYQPEMMSGLILKLYPKHLNGVDLRLDEEIKISRQLDSAYRRQNYARPKKRGLFKR